MKNLNIVRKQGELQCDLGLESACMILGSWTRIAEDSQVTHSKECGFLLEDNRELEGVTKQQSHISLFLRNSLFYIQHILLPF